MSIWEWPTRVIRRTVKALTQRGVAMRTKTTFRIEAIEQLKRELDAMPPCPVEEVNKTRAVHLLAPQIVAMRSRGYSIVAIRRMLAERGLDISEVSLRRHARRGNSSAVDRRARRGTSTASKARGANSET
jgi:hypothetical protein